MNVNYVRTPDLPKYPEYGSLLQALARDEYFISTGEVLLRDASISGPPDQIVVRARLSYTFPLNLAEVVWGNGSATFRQVFPLDTTREFGEASFEWKVEAKNWRWARLAVWDVAADGVLGNPLWRDRTY